MTSNKTWYVLGVNPRPWAVGPLSSGRNATGKVFATMGRNQELHAYEAALAATMLLEYPYLREFIDAKLLKKFPDLRRYVTGDPAKAKDRSLWAGAHVELTFHFWQKLEVAEVNGRRIVDKAADLTNMVKAAEDAVQGLLLNNDTQVRAQRNVFYQCGEEVPEGLVVISIQPFISPDPDELPSFVWERIEQIFRNSNEEDGNASASLFDF
jgi:hypothetical protein